MIIPLGGHKEQETNMQSSSALNLEGSQKTSTSQQSKTKASITIAWTMWLSLMQKLQSVRKERVDSALLVKKAYQATARSELVHN